jgi:predicted ATPase
VLIALAGALGVHRPDSQHAVDQVAEVLADERALVVLDNFEHLLPAAVHLGRLLAACSGLRVLVTSRERLRLVAEREFPVQPLEIPSPADSGNLSAVAANPCVALLLDRAQRVRPQLALTTENATALVTACVRLDGIPLALELAAGRWSRSAGSRPSSPPLLMAMRTIQRDPTSRGRRARSGCTHRPGS